jgi:hypothetical protein
MDKNESTGLPENPVSNRKSWLNPLRLTRNRYLIVVGVFTLMGVIGGYTYYALVGCNTGGCAITSSPVMSIIWGGMMGYLLPDIFVKQKS